MGRNTLLMRKVRIDWIKLAERALAIGFRDSFSYASFTHIVILSLDVSSHCTMKSPVGMPILLLVAIVIMFQWVEQLAFQMSFFC